jgi:hypothetical protein
VTPVNDAPLATAKSVTTQPPFLGPPVRTIGSFRGLPHKANS